MPQGVIASCLTLERLFKLAEAHFYYFLMKMSDNLCLRDVIRIKRETSMVVQWLRIHASTTEGVELIFGWGTKNPTSQAEWPIKKVCS